ncbi:MAG TPA: cadmium resistance transporter [Candidatus Limosilactobacillus merdipullorum]|uniref:Cadmium resistance transporter n=1 Tax=Candidatus Limosilactobacillus merdipullorum TaxID=2838653 RepID=A0A9D1QQX9_9LACO|nr:cadmium resistance transporter [Candidatus Limosilactobacillus merdipullorum]
MNWWVLTLTFLAVNLDFFFILLLLLDKFKLRDVVLGYLGGVLVLVVASYFAGQVLAMFLPEWVLGMLGILPIWMALHDNDEDPNSLGNWTPSLTVLVTYLSVCAGCNLSIFLPVLTNVTGVQFVEVLLYVGIFTVIIVCLLKMIGEIPVVKHFMAKYSEILMKVVYVGVGMYVFWDSGLVSHLMKLI